MDYIKELRKLVGKMPVILVGSVVIILDENKRVLLQQRTHPYGVWGLPGGLMELGESSEETAIREVKEETGLTVSGLKLHHLYSGERFFTVAANGDPFYSVTAVFSSNTYQGPLVLNKEVAIHLAFFSYNEMPDAMVGSHREFIDNYFKTIK